LQQYLLALKEIQIEQVVLPQEKTGTHQTPEESEDDLDGEEATKVFISYSHSDRNWLDRIRIHLKPLERSNKIDLWSDEKIKSGMDWKDEIENALAKARVALLLISADFLASDFIVEDELPHLLEKASQNETIILPLIVKPSRFLREPSLSKFQSVNNPEEPLIDMPESKREHVLVQLAETIESYLE